MAAGSALDGMWLGKRRIVRRIGVGGMGDVYLADEPYLHRQVAIKVIRGELASGNDSAENDVQRRFAQEARAVAALDHPNILPLYDYGEQDGLHYLVMPYIADGSLAELLTRDPQHRFTPPLPPMQVAQIIGQCADALQYAHDRGIIHRDVKPQNLLVRLASSVSAPLPAPAPSPLHIWLADFGVARFIEELSSRTGATGTPLYSPPEQFAGRPVYASDQYALACVAYLLLTGQPVFRGSIVELYPQHLSAAPSPPSRLNPALPDAVDAAVLRALAKLASDRFPRVEQFAQALAVAVQSDTGHSRQGVTPLVRQPTPRDDGIGVNDAGQTSPTLTKIDPLRQLHEAYTVPDTAHMRGAADAAYARPSGAAPTPGAPAPLRSTATKHQARRTAQRALLLALAVAVVLAALFGVGAASGDFATLRGLGGAGARTTTSATATATGAPTATLPPYTPSGFTRISGQWFSLAYPTQWTQNEAGVVQNSGDYVVIQDHTYPSAYNSGFPLVQATELGLITNVEDIFGAVSGTITLGQETMRVVNGVQWRLRSAKIDTGHGIITFLVVVCTHYEASSDGDAGFAIEFSSLDTFTDDYNHYYNPIWQSFAFTN